MKIEWNKVTWYSKIIALILFVALPFIGFWYGTEYGETVAFLKNPPVFQSASSTTPESEYYSNPAEWQTDTNSAGGFSIAYPLDFNPQDNYSMTPSTDWRLNSNGVPGLKMLTITIPSAFEPETNFVDAELTVGMSQDNAAIQDCLTPDQDADAATSTATINGISFFVSHFTGVGAGNYYDTTSYRTVHAGACYAVEYTIHSAQILNYPAEYNLQPFNEGMVSAVLDRIVGTFRFQ